MTSNTVNVAEKKEVPEAIDYFETKDKIMKLLDWGLSYSEKTEAANHIINNQDKIRALFSE